MNFKRYLAELNDIELGQAFEKHETPIEGSIFISNSKIRAEINFALDLELDEIFNSPESGIQKVRNVLGRFNIDFPALYGADSDGDEVVFDIGEYYLYLIYSLTDDGHYEFYAEVTDEEGLEEILSDEDEEEEV